MAETNVVCVRPYLQSPVLHHAPFLLLPGKHLTTIRHYMLPRWKVEARTTRVALFKKNWQKARNKMCLLEPVHYLKMWNRMAGNYCFKGRANQRYIKDWYICPPNKDYEQNSSIPGNIKMTQLNWTNKFNYKDKCI